MNTTKKSTRVWIAGSLVFAVFFSFAPQAYALNQTGDWSFTNNTNWTWTNTVNTNTCGNTTSTTNTAFSVFARDSTGVVSSRSNNATKSGSIVQGGNVNQTIIATSSGSVNYKGRFDFSSSIGGAGIFSSVAWARADIYNNTNGTWVGLIGCSSFSAATATTTVSNNQPIVLTGGTTYTIRLSTSLKSVNTTGTSNNIYMDKVVVSAPPVNGAISAPTNTKNALLTWDVSTATTSANGLAAANGYGIYRGTSSGAETALASSTSASYTDSATVGNTTYYYWLTNTDTASYESASSTQLSLLTKPDAPSTPTFSSVTDTTLTVLWNPPTGGASTYDVERCTGAACNSGWTTVSSAQAGTSFGDSGLVKSTTYGYRIVGNNATGAGVYSATGYTTTNSFSPPAAVPTRTLRLFEGFKIKFTSGKIILRQKQ